MKTGYLLTWQTENKDDEGLLPVMVTSKKALMNYLSDVISDLGKTFMESPYEETYFYGFSVQPIPVVDEKFSLEDMKDEP